MKNIEKDKKNISRSFGSCVFFYRKERNFSQTALAKASGTAHSTISRIEAEVTVPNIELAVSIANALGFSLSELQGKMK